MNTIFVSVALFCLLISINLIDARKKNPAEKCSMCNTLVTNFVDVLFLFLWLLTYHFLIIKLTLFYQKGLKKTQKGNFGGGNTGNKNFQHCFFQLEWNELEEFNLKKIRLGRQETGQLFNIRNQIWRNNWTHLLWNWGKFMIQNIHLSYIY